MEFETEFADQNCLIKIKDKKFVRSLNTGHKIKGKVELIKLKFGQLYRLKSNKSNIEIDVEGSTYHPSDTIFFRTKRVGEKDSDDALTIYSGKLIKLK